MPLRQSLIARVEPVARVLSEDLGPRLNRLHLLVGLGMGAGRRSRPAPSVAIPHAAHGRLLCAYGCSLTDANPSIEVKGGKAECMN
jgi:hypothetical protein